VAPIVFERCAGCHRPGEPAPFPLLSYRDVQKRGPMIKLVTGRRYMPPWRPAHGYGDLADVRALSDREIALIARWVDSGMARGPDEAMPAPPAFTEGWQLGVPDLVVEMPEVYEVPADGPDIYRNFVLPLGTTGERWVAAVEVRPSARAAVHHALFFLDTTGQARELDPRDPEPGFSRMGFQQSGSLGGWAVGGVPKRLPFGLGRPLPKGADLVVQTHFHPTGRPEEERLKVGVYFTEKKPERTLVDFQVPPVFGRFARIDIPAGERAFTIRERFELPVDLELVAAWGHAHKVCASMRARAVLPDGRIEPLLHIPRWDFQWQGHYPFAHTVPLPKGTVIEAEIVYDNSADNPANPYDPPQRIRWGIESNDEMGSLIFSAVPAREDDAPRFEQAVIGQAFLAQLRGEGADRALRRLQRADRNGDGVLTLFELPDRVRPFFPALDADGDGLIGSSDIDRLRAVPEGSGNPFTPVYLDLAGRAEEPLEVRRGEQATLLCFVAKDCPIANAYAPELNELAKLARERSVRMLLVEVDPDATDEAAREHARSFGLASPVIVDRDLALARRLGVRATPEVVLLLPRGEVFYQGAIDDRFADLGERRETVRHAWLRTALDELAAGRAAASTRRTDPVGCLLPEAAGKAAPAPARGSF
jgi:hypothetical protein